MDDINATLARRQQLTLADLNADVQRREILARQNMASQQDVLRQYQMQLQSQDQARALNARAIQMEADRRAAAALNASRLQAATQEGNAERQTRANIEGARLDEQGREHNAQLWEQAQRRQQGAFEFDAQRADNWDNAAMNRDQRAYEFDTSARQHERQLSEQARQFDLGQANQVDRDVFSAQMDERGRGEAYAQQREQAILQAQLHDWLKQQDFTHQDQMQLNQLQRAVSAVMNDEDLSPQERQAAVLKLKAGIDIGKERMMATQRRAEEMQVAELQRRVALENKIQADNDEFHAGRLESRIVIDRTTGARYTTDRNGQIHELTGHIKDKEREEQARIQGILSIMQHYESDEGKPISPEMAAQIFDQMRRPRGQQPQAGPGEQMRTTGIGQPGSRQVPGGMPGQPAAPPAEAPQLRSKREGERIRLEEEKRKEAERVRVEKEKEKRNHFIEKRVGEAIKTLENEEIKKKGSVSPEAAEKIYKTATDRANRELDADIEIRANPEEKYLHYWERAREVALKIQALEYKDKRGFDATDHADYKTLRAEFEKWHKKAEAVRGATPYAKPGDNQTQQGGQAAAEPPKPVQMTPAETDLASRIDAAIARKKAQEESRKATRFTDRTFGPGM